jgi:predicted nucleic acid-binding protein
MPDNLVAWGYFDTSVLVKSYVEEHGTAGARAFLKEYAVLSSVITPIELTSAFRRRAAMAEITGRQIHRLLLRLEQDRQYWLLIALEQAVLVRAEELCKTTPLRTPDALHVASALFFRETSQLRPPFITADNLQREVAADFGLNVHWVE